MTASIDSSAPEQHGKVSERNAPVHKRCCSVSVFIVWANEGAPKRPLIVNNPITNNRPATMPGERRASGANSELDPSPKPNNTGTLPSPNINITRLP